MDRHHIVSAQSHIVLARARIFEFLRIIQETIVRIHGICEGRPQLKI